MRAAATALAVSIARTRAGAGAGAGARARARAVLARTRRRGGRGGRGRRALTGAARARRAGQLGRRLVRLKFDRDSATAKHGLVELGHRGRCVRNIVEFDKCELRLQLHARKRTKLDERLLQVGICRLLRVVIDHKERLVWHQCAFLFALLDNAIALGVLDGQGALLVHDAVQGANRSVALGPGLHVDECKFGLEIWSRSGPSGWCARVPYELVGNQ